MIINLGKTKIRIYNLLCVVFFKGWREAYMGPPPKLKENAYNKEKLLYLINSVRRPILSPWGSGTLSGALMSTIFKEYGGCKEKV